MKKILFFYLDFLAVWSHRYKLHLWAVFATLLHHWGNLNKQFEALRENLILLLHLKWKNWSFLFQVHWNGWEVDVTSYKFNSSKPLTKMTGIFFQLLDHTIQHFLKLCKTLASLSQSVVVAPSIDHLNCSNLTP